jgi:hypothetical protein
MNLARLLRDQLREALKDSGEGDRQQRNVAISSNIGRAGHSTTVYSDDDVTIIERDGERQVIRHTPDQTDTSNE